MNPTLRAAVAVTMLALGCGSVFAAEPPDPADLFPPETLVYAELHGPAELVPQVATLVKGTTLEKGLAPLVKRPNDGRAPGDAGDTLLTLLLASPEVLTDLKNVRGVAVGVTGLHGPALPEYAIVVVTGESKAIPIAVQDHLKSHKWVRKVGTVGGAGVPVYQYRNPTPQPNDPFDEPIEKKPEKADDRPVTDGPYETTVAFTPGLVVIGTSKAAVGAVVTRFLGEVKDGLGGTDGFRAAAAAHRKPGVFFYATPAELIAKYDAARRRFIGMPEPEEVAWLKLVVNPRAVRSVGGCVRLSDGGLSLTAGVILDPTQASPLAAVLGASGAKLELLHPAPRSAVAAFAVVLPEKSRGAAVVRLLDALVMTEGELGRLPGDVVREVEQKFKVAVMDGLLADTRAVTIVFPAMQELPQGAKPFPTLVFHTESPQAAAAWEGFLPKLAADLGRANAVSQPSIETVNGIRVFSLGGPGMPWNGPVHYARVGTRFVVGPDRKIVAAIAAADPALSVVGGERPAKFPDLTDDTVLIGTVSPGVVLRTLFDGPAGMGNPNGPDGTSNTLDLPQSGIRPIGGPQPNPAQADEQKAWNALLLAIDDLPPPTVTVRRVGTELRVEVFQPGAPAGGLGPVLNAGATWLEKNLTRPTDPNRTPYGRPRRR